MHSCEGLLQDGGRPPDFAAEVRTAARCLEEARRATDQRFQTGTVLGVCLLIAGFAIYFDNPLAGLMAAGLLALPLVALMVPFFEFAPLLRRRSLCARLRRLATALPAAELAESLARARAHPDPVTRELAAPVAKGLCLPGEVTPSAAPGGRGSEPAGSAVAQGGMAGGRPAPRRGGDADEAPA